jgi:hypothetical protein
MEFVGIANSGHNTPERFWNTDLHDVKQRQAVKDVSDI